MSDRGEESGASAQGTPSVLPELPRASGRACPGEPAAEGGRDNSGLTDWASLVFLQMRQDFKIVFDS